MRQIRLDGALGPYSTKALLLFGDAASCAQWDSLSSPWAPQGQQPEVPTSGKRKSSTVYGLMDSVSGRFFSNAQTRVPPRFV
jgi:hypothetical protein